MSKKANTNKKTSKVTAGKKRKSGKRVITSRETRGSSEKARKWATVAYFIGILGLVVMALMELKISLEAFSFTSEVMAYGLVESLIMAFFGAILWVPVGVFCLILCFAQRKVPTELQSDLIGVGILNILGIIGLVFYPLLYRAGIVVWLILWGIILAWIIRRAKKRGIKA